MSAVRRFRRAVVALVVLYVLLGVVPKPFRMGQPEWFPFFSWSLFSRVPQDGVRLTARVLELDGVVLDPPVPLLEAVGRAADPDERARLLKDLWLIHKGLRDGVPRRIERGRRRLEDRWLGDRPARYEVHRARRDLLDRDAAGTASLSLGVYERGVGLDAGEPER